MSIRHLLLCLSFTALALSACGGGTLSQSTPAAASTPAVGAAPYDALVASAMHLAADGRAARAEFKWSIDRDSFHLSGDGTYLVTTSGDLQHETHYRGEGSVPSLFNETNDSQIIMLSDAAYVLSPWLGPSWVMFTPQEFGPDWTAVRRLASARSPVDYSTVVRAMKDNATAMGAEPIDGHAYDRYRASADANALMEAMADAYANQGQIMFVDRFSGPVETDIWIDPLTSLPRRIHADGNISYLSGDTRIAITVDYTDFHPAANVTAPASSITLRELASSR